MMAYLMYYTNSDNITHHNVENHKCEVTCTVKDKKESLNLFEKENEVFNI